MKHTNFARRAISFSVGAVSSLLGLVLFAPSAFAIVVKPGGGGILFRRDAPNSSFYRPQHRHPAAWLGWQITLIAVGAALLAATIATFMGRARTAHQVPRVSAA